MAPALAGQTVQAPARLEVDSLPPTVSLDGPTIPAALVAGDLAAARRLTAAWRFRNPTGAPPPVVPLTAALYRLSLGGQEVQVGPLTFVQGPRRPPLDRELGDHLAEAYTRLARRLLDAPPPPVRVHLVESLTGALHGVHLAGHLAVERDGLPDVLLHELTHFLLARDAGGRSLLRRLPWLEEGLAEWYSRSDDVRLRSAPPRCEDLPADPGGLFPVPQLSRRPGARPGAGYLPAAYAAALVEGGRSPFREGIPGLLRRLEAGEPATVALEKVSGGSAAALARRWQETMQAACLPAALERTRGVVRDRLGAFDALHRGDLEAAARGLADAARRVSGPTPAWLVSDAIGLGSRLVRIPEGQAALARLAHALPWAGLAIPGAFQQDAWAEPLETLLAEDPPPRALLYLTLMLWQSPHRGRILEAWTAGLARHAEETEWIQAEALHTAFMGRLQPPPEAPYARVSRRMEAIARRLEGRADRAPDLAEGVAEARAAYAFGARDFATAEAVLEAELAAAGWDARRAMNLAACRFRRGDRAGAEDVYLRALMLAPASSGLRVGLAAIRLEEGRWEEAGELLAGLDPAGEDGYRVLTGRAAVARALGQEEEAARLEAAAAELGTPPSDSPVPALFQVMVLTPLEKLAAELSARR